MANYRNHDRQQIEMKMMCINDFVPRDHMARVIVSIVESLDLSSFDSYFRNDEGGHLAYPISSLLPLLIYAFFNGNYKGRKIERECKENIVFRYLCCDDPPDHSTISRFWTRFKDQINNIMTQTVYIGLSEGIIDFKHLSGDGVRLKSMGSSDMIINEKSAITRMENIEKQLERLNKEVEENINLSVDEKDKINQIIEEKESLKIRIEKGLNDLKETQDHIKKQKAVGEKIENTNYLSLTESAAKKINTKDGAISGYNAQALVDSKTNMIISDFASSTVTDTYNGKPLLENALNTFGKDSFKYSQFSLDNGYVEEDLFAFGIENKLDLYVDIAQPPKVGEEKLKNRKSRTPNLIYDEKKNIYVCPMKKELTFQRINYTFGRAYAVYELKCPKCKLAKDCIKDKWRQRKRKSRRVYELDNDEIINQNKGEPYCLMEQKMSTKEAKAIYKTRFSNVEPVFGQIKEIRGFRRFTVWGLENVNAQWSFVCFVHNIFKIIEYSGYSQMKVAA